MTFFFFAPSSSSPTYYHLCLKISIHEPLCCTIKDIHSSSTTTHIKSHTQTWHTNLAHITLSLAKKKRNKTKQTRAINIKVHHNTPQISIPLSSLHPSFSHLTTTSPRPRNIKIRHIPRPRPQIPRITTNPHILTMRRHATIQEEQLMPSRR